MPQKTHLLDSFTSQYTNDIEQVIKPALHFIESVETQRSGMYVSPTLLQTRLHYHICAPCLSLRHATSITRLARKLSCLTRLTSRHGVPIVSFIALNQEADVDRLLLNSITLLF